jgi:hypothetical protein
MSESLLTLHTITTLGTDESRELFKIQTLGNGYCGENAFVLKLRALAEQEKLNQVFRDQAAFARFLRHCVRSLPKLRPQSASRPFMGDFVTLLDQYSNNLTLKQFADFLKSAKKNEQLHELQLTLAPVFRSYLRELQQNEQVNTNDTAHLDDKELSILATALNLELHICLDEQESNNKSSTFSESTVNNVTKDSLNIYIVHTKPMVETEENKGDGHWSLGILAEEKESVAFWQAIQNSSNKNAQLQVTEQDKQSAFESVFDIGKRILSELDDRFNDQSSNIYNDIVFQINDAVGKIYDELDALLQTNSTEQLKTIAEEKIQTAYNEAIKSYSVKAPQTAYSQRQSSPSVRASLQQALAPESNEFQYPRQQSPEKPSIGQTFNINGNFGEIKNSPTDSQQKSSFVYKKA